MGAKRFRWNRTRLFWAIYRMTPDPWIYSIMYFKRFHRFINWRNPQGFNQKINYLKRYYRNPLQTVCADKYGVREYVREKIGEEHLNGIYGIYNTAEEINFDELPKEFVLKATHGNRMNIICDNKDDLDIAWARKTLNGWLKQNFYYHSKEWQYKNIPPRILAEPLLREMDSLKDYRFYCFNGVPQFIRVIYDRATKKPKEKLYKKNWEPIKGSWHFPEKQSELTKPDKLQEMIYIAEALSGEFPFVRVDLYNPGERILVGELTFHPGNGFLIGKPNTLDEEFGKLLKVRKY